MPRNNKRKSTDSKGTPKLNNKSQKMGDFTDSESGKQKDLESSTRNEKIQSKTIEVRRNPSRAKKKLNYDDQNNNATIGFDERIKTRQRLPTKRGKVEGRSTVKSTDKSQNKSIEKVVTPRNLMGDKLIERSKTVMKKGSEKTRVSEKELKILSDADQLNNTIEFENEGIQVTVNAAEDDYRTDTDESATDTADTETETEESQTDSESTRRRSFWESIKDEPEAMGFISQLIDERIKDQESKAGRRNENSPRTPKQGNTVLRSPSADTVYKQVLTKKIPDQAGFQKTNSKQQTPNRIDTNSLNQMLSDIRSKFNYISEPQPGTSRQDDERNNNGFRRRESSTAATRSPRQPSPHFSQPPPVNNAKTEAEKLILDAERFKAAIAPPQGEVKLTQLQLQRLLDTDDDFFHVSSHVENSLVLRIEKGEYIELEKLKQKGEANVEDDSRMELVNRNGMSYWVAARDKESKITNVKRWDEAFRIYSTIYSRANPSRAAEVMQYIDTIHVAAASYAWENVYKYDKKFRQLMAAKPFRNWGKTYTHMWNICLTEPINRSFNNANSSYQNSSSHRKSSDGRSSGNTCWKFNRNKCTRPNCAFEHKCSYCGSYSHAYPNCSKRQRRSDNQQGRQGNNKQSRQTDN